MFCLFWLKFLLILSLLQITCLQEDIICMKIHSMLKPGILVYPKVKGVPYEKLYNFDF